MMLLRRTMVSGLLQRLHDTMPAMDLRNRCARRSSRCLPPPGATAIPAEVAHPFFWAPMALIGEGGTRQLSTRTALKGPA